MWINILVAIGLLWKLFFNLNKYAFSLTSHLASVYELGSSPNKIYRNEMWRLLIGSSEENHILLQITVYDAQSNEVHIWFHLVCASDTGCWESIVGYLLFKIFSQIYYIWMFWLKRFNKSRENHCLYLVTELEGCRYNSMAWFLSIRISPGLLIEEKHMLRAPKHSKGNFSQRVHAWPLCFH